MEPQRPVALLLSEPHLRSEVNNVDVGVRSCFSILDEFLSKKKKRVVLTHFVEYLKFLVGICQIDVIKERRTLLREGAAQQKSCQNN